MPWLKDDFSHSIEGSALLLYTSTPPHQSVHFWGEPDQGPSPEAADEVEMRSEVVLKWRVAGHSSFAGVVKFKSCCQAFPMMPPLVASSEGAAWGPGFGVPTTLGTTQSLAPFQMKSFEPVLLA